MLYTSGIAPRYAAHGVPLGAIADRSWATGPPFCVIADISALARSSRAAAINSDDRAAAQRPPAATATLREAPRQL